jgi:hypothetical protein
MTDIIDPEYVAEVEKKLEEIQLELRAEKLATKQLKDYIRWGSRSVYTREVCQLMGWKDGAV